MNHYDGPAFYRKFVHDGTINKNHKLDALRSEKEKYSERSTDVTGFSKDIQRTNFDNFRPRKTKATHIDLQNNPIARITANFKPRRHYGTPDHSTNYVSHEPSGPSEFEKISDHYHHLTSELTPKDDDVTLLTSSKADSESRSGSLHFKLASNADNNQTRPLSRSQTGFNQIPVQNSVSLSDQEVEDDHDSRLERDEAESHHSVSSASDQHDDLKNDQSNLNSASENEIHSSNDSNLESSIATSTSNSLLHHTKDSLNVSNSDSEQVKSLKREDAYDNSSSSSTDNSEPLGHNFSSIMHDENQDIRKNLTLFNKSNSSRSNSDLTSHDNNGATLSTSSNDSEDSTKISDSTDGDESEQGSDSNDDDDQHVTHPATSDNQSSTFIHRPNFVAQNPTNVQPSNDFDDSDSEDEEHHNIKPSVIKNYKFPGHELLVAPKHYNDQGLDNWILNKAEILNKTLRAFNVNAQVVDWTNGPTVTQFQVKLHLGVKVSKINHLSDDLKMALAAKDIRIQAPIPGKTTCGIEIPNPKPRPVMLSEVVNSKTFRESKSDLTIALGVDLTGKPRVTDLRKMPHGLIAGATGSGKSVFINCMLISLMYKATPQELKMILIDPKAVEFAPYNGIPYLLSPVISEPKQAAASLKWATKEMNQRYEKLAAAGVRNIEQFNKKADENHKPQMKMPYILIVIDELADLMMVAGDEIETYIVRITQKARAAGIHLVVATQRPSVDVITGTMKNNIPTRVAFMVSSQVDSRTIIDQSGAERLLGKGDMLYLGNGSSHPIRLQGCFVSNQEIDKVAGFTRHQEPAHYAFHPGSLLKHVSRIENQDKLMPQVLAYIAKEKTVSTSKLQRVFSIGYNRSAKIIDNLEQHGYISGQEGSKPRDVYLSEKDYKKLNL